MDHLRSIVLSDVTETHLQWLWQGRIPLGTITLLDGDPGLGKSLLLLDLIAPTTTGWPMPDEACEFEREAPASGPRPAVEL